MDPEDSIVPMCLYSSSTSSFIGYPTKVRLNGKTVVQCESAGAPSSNSNMKFITQFYVINPDIHPIPTSVDLICVENAFNASTNIKQLYDPFNIDEHCIRILAWMEPTPYTSPLYFMKNGNTMYISFDNTPPNENYKPAEIPVLYVLTDPRQDFFKISGPRRPEITGPNKTFKITVNNVPYFTFSGYQGRCVPDPNGRYLGECMALVDKNILSLNKIGQENGILDYLENRYGKDTTIQHSQVFIVMITTVLTILILLSVWTIWKYTN